MRDGRKSFAASDVADDTVCGGRVNPFAVIFDAGAGANGAVPNRHAKLKLYCLPPPGSQGTSSLALVLRLLLVTWAIGN